jgi:hypothetical protein
MQKQAVYICLINHGIETFNTEDYCKINCKFKESYVHVKWNWYICTMD